jgi:hypothetical protein
MTTKAALVLKSGQAPVYGDFPEPVASDGRLVVQIAKYLGAKRVIATGRNTEALKSLASLGADVTISLTEDGEALEKAFLRPFHEGVDVVLLGSFGGYLAPRAVAYEHRLAACVAIDGVYSFGEATEMTAQPQEQEAGANVRSQQSTMLRWAIAQGMRTLDAHSPLEIMQKARLSTMQGCAEKITCPLLICDVQEDLFFKGQAKKLSDAVRCPKTYLSFSNEESAGEHCQAGALTRLNQELFAWLDQTLG